MTSERLATEIKATVDKINITSNASLMTAYDKELQLLSLKASLCMLLEQFTAQIDRERRDISTQKEKAHIVNLYAKTLDLVDVETLRGRRAIAA